MFTYLVRGGTWDLPYINASLLNPYYDMMWDGVSCPGVPTGASGAVSSYTSTFVPGYPDAWSGTLSVVNNPSVNGC